MIPDRLTLVREFTRFLAAALVAGLAGFVGGCVTRNPPAPPNPPPMILRPLSRPTNALSGETIPLRAGRIRATLHLPDGWEQVPHRLAIHFHTADWVGFGEHRRAGYRFPVVSVLLGSGSAKYRAPFADGSLFPELIRRVEQELRARGAQPGTVQDVDVASFSAGYGAVRELVQQPAARRLIRRLVLSDSLYAGLSSGADGTGPRVVQVDQVACWLPFARDAVAGRTTFVLTHSQIPTPAYASTAECANALITALALKAAPSAPGSSASTGNWPLLQRCDAGRFHVWSYGGTNANAHLVHPRNLAEVWRVLDAVERSP